MISLRVIAYVQNQIHVSDYKHLAIFCLKNIDGDLYWIIDTLPPPKVDDIFKNSNVDELGKFLSDMHNLPYIGEVKRSKVYLNRFPFEEHHLNFLKDDCNE